METNPTEVIYTSHHDVDRQGVGITAHVVAAVRAIESSRAEGKRLINDPFAEDLAGKVGKDYLLSYSRFGLFLLSSDLIRMLFWFLSPFLQRFPELGMIDGLAIRTRTIDDEIRYSLRNQGIEQICVLGAGLDSRPWRLQMEQIFQQSPNPNVEGDHKPSEIVEQLKKNISYFEYDFPETFRYKLDVIKRHQAVSEFQYKNVEGDLSLPNWPDQLLLAGFQTNRPTLWILEGFTGYLTPEEFQRLFGAVSNQLSASGSRCIITFVKPTARRLPVTKNMHKFRPDNPVELLQSFGWTDVKEESFEDAGIRLHREIYPLDSTIGHVFVTGEKR